MSLTRRQRQILDFIAAFLKEHGYAPSLMEVGRAFGLTSPATVHKHLLRLEAKGKIRRSPHGRRSVELVPEEGSPHAVELPLLGRVAAGRPIEAVEDRRMLAVPESMVGPGEGYVLQVLGDSMIEEQVRDGDFIVVENRREAANGEMVVALLGGRDVTLKKFYRESGRVRLQPANAALAPLIVSGGSVKIQGVVRGLLRLY
jgi:repressor LexA